MIIQELDSLANAHESFSVALMKELSKGVTDFVKEKEITRKKVPHLPVLEKELCLSCCHYMFARMHDSDFTIAYKRWPEAYKGNESSA